MEAAVRREVWEEASVSAVPREMIAIRNQVTPRRNDLLAIWLMEHEAGEPKADGEEIAAAGYFELTTALGLPDLSSWAKHMLGLARNESSGFARNDYKPGSAGLDEAWILYSKR